MENPFYSGSRRSDLIFNSSSSSSSIVSCYHAEHSNAKRQLFLRSYQFSRKRSVSERMKGFAVKVKRVILFRLRSARRLRKLAWSALCFRRGRSSRFRFLRLVDGDFDAAAAAAAGMRHKSSCLW